MDQLERLFAEGRAVRVPADLTGLDERVRDIEAQRTSHQRGRGKKSEGGQL
ncbi:hypothetical protein ABZX30_33180 [Streptomyces sp. NPDC004542]|uniref:hypothetical protein n=1 Tax=Streptomyces sp. NPDC004542 TaxID=3154281 RepID=UPI0033AD9049